MWKMVFFNVVLDLLGSVLFLDCLVYCQLLGPCLVCLSARIPVSPLSVNFLCLTCLSFVLSSPPLCSDIHLYEPTQQMNLTMPPKSTQCISTGEERSAGVMSGGRMNRNRGSFFAPLL